MDIVQFLQGVHSVLAGHAAHAGAVVAWAPPIWMAVAVVLSSVLRTRLALLWRVFIVLLVVSLAFTLVALVLPWLSSTSVREGGFSPAGQSGHGQVLAAWLAVLVQLLGVVIGAFSSRYLQGEPRQARYIAALAAVLAAVHVLLLAQHWVVLIAAWAAVGLALERLLCFYPDRPFALLAAHKKRIADRLADVLLVVAAALAWATVGSGALADVWLHVAQHGASPALQASAVCLVLAVVLRTALLPVHGWLIQVMEAPTPVSALLHAGVVNLGGYVLIRFAPLLEAAPTARWLLVGFGLAAAFLAGLVMLTRISIKVRLAWSTVAQMGFMVLECGLGLYSLAALHLMGHSLYKAHAFLSASSAVQHTKLQMMQGSATPSVWSLLFAPVLAVATVMVLQTSLAPNAWPWWWSAVLALAWAPLLWLPACHAQPTVSIHTAPQTPLHTSTYAALWPRIVLGFGGVAGLTALALVAHALPFGLVDVPLHLAGWLALLGMAAMYLCLVLLQVQPQYLTRWRRWSYAGFYVDETYTRLALRLWPARWTPVSKAPCTST